MKKENKKFLKIIKKNKGDADLVGLLIPLLKNLDKKLQVKISHDLNREGYISDLRIYIHDYIDKYSIVVNTQELNLEKRLFTITTRGKYGKSVVKMSDKVKFASWHSKSSDEFNLWTSIKGCLSTTLNIDPQMSYDIDTFDKIVSIITDLALTNVNLLYSEELLV